MRIYFYLIAFASLLAAGYKKENVSPSALGLLQHKWMLNSFCREAFRYIDAPDDYFNFSSDNFLYRHSDFFSTI